MSRKNVIQHLCRPNVYNCSEQTKNLQIIVLHIVKLYRPTYKLFHKSSLVNRVGRNPANSHYEKM